MPATARIGPYRVLRLIKQGGQGGVYLGYDKRLRRPVAIKVHSLPRERAGRKRLLREAQLVASIHSSKVVQVYDLVVGNSHVAMIMEYVPGCDLEDLLSRAQPSVPSVLTVATDLAAALAAARQQGIVHGDLKAKNVLVTETGRVKLSDFGIARTGSDSTPGTQELRSPSCVSPEQYRGESLDIRSDLFALGCLLYRMLSGEQPFVRDGRLDVESLLAPDPPSLGAVARDLPEGLADLVENLLQKQPADRPGDTQQVRSILRNISREIPLSISSTLLQEARSSFRLESPGDIPPEIPRDLRRGSRSTFGQFQLGTLSSWGDLLRPFTPRQLGLAGFSISIILAWLLWQWLPEATRIQIDKPEMPVATGQGLPPSVSAAWLVEEIKLAASSQLGEIVVTGPVGATEPRTLYGSLASPKPQESLSASLHCSGELCLFVVNRVHAGRTQSEQALLFLDMSVAQWSSIIQSTTRALYL